MRDRARSYVPSWIMLSARWLSVKRNVLGSERFLQVVPFCVPASDRSIRKATQRRGGTYDYMAALVAREVALPKIHQWLFDDHESHGSMSGVV